MFRLKAYAAAAVGFVGIILGVYFFARREGAEAVRNEIDDQILDDMRIAKDVRENVEILDDVDLATRASSWVRTTDD